MSSSSFYTVFNFVNKDKDNEHENIDKIAESLTTDTSYSYEDDEESNFPNSSSVETVSLVDRSSISKTSSAHDDSFQKIVCSLFFTFDANTDELENKITQESVLELFTCFGRVSRVHLEEDVVDEVTGLRRGFGFVYYEKSSAGVQAVQLAAKEMAYTVIGDVTYCCHALLSQQSVIHLHDGILYEISSRSEEPRRLEDDTLRDADCIFLDDDMNDMYPSSLQF